MKKARQYVDSILNKKNKEKEYDEDEKEVEKHLTHDIKESKKSISEDVELKRKLKNMDWKKARHEKKTSLAIN